VIDLGPRADLVQALFDEYLAERYGRCRRCGGPMSAHLVRPILRCEHRCDAPA